MWTKHRIQTLQNQAAQVQSRIRDLFIRTAITLDDNRRAWGQFLDESRDNNQYGVYGTSAGIQVLIMSNYPAEDRLVAGADLTLGDVFRVEPGEDEILFLKHDDLFILYKMAYLAEAAQPGRPNLTECRAVNEIIENVLNGRGWGEYFYSERERDEHPKVVATAVALLAISRYQNFRIQDACRNAVRWLSSRVMENGSLGPHEYALAAIALHEYKIPGVDIAEYATAIETCKERLIEWAKTRREEDIGESTVYYYSTCMETHRENRYLFFFPDCLAALALLKLDNPIKIRRYVLRVLEHFIEHTSLNHGYVAKATGKVSSVDQLWIFRLMKECRSGPAELLLPPYFFLWRGATTPIRILLSSLFLLLGITGLYFSFTTSYSMGTRIFGGALGSISLALFARTLWEFILVGEKK